MRRNSLLPLLSLPLAIALAGCDNPACVFGPNGCQEGDGSDSIGSLPASEPSDGVWITPGPPSFQRMAPVGSAAHPSTPIVLVYSESLHPESVQNAYQVVDATFGTPVPLVEPPPLVGDGRVVVLSPLAPLQLGTTYSVSYREGASVTDLTGVLVSTGVTGDIGNFSVAATTPETPEVIATFPDDSAVDQSDIGEIVAVFDRPMDPTSVDTDSFAVTVNGVTPTHNPAPVPLTILGGPIPVAIESVWRWASVDGEGLRVSLGAAGGALVEFSQPGSKIEDDDGQQVPATVLAFDIAPIAVPFRVDKAVLSDPDDAIGRPNLNDVVPVLQVELSANAQSGDDVELYLFGTGKGSSQDLVALSRKVDVDAATMLVDVMPSDLQLLSGGSGVVKDGNLYVAARIKRGDLRTTVRLVDVDEDQNGAQPLLFDVTAPQLVGLGTSGQQSSTFSSDLVDMVIVGRANEQIRRVEASASTGDDNGVDPEVIMATSGGLFVAKPVPVGILDREDPPATYTVRIFDRALNPQAGSVTGTFYQRGTVGPGVAPEGGQVAVYVFDAATLTPVQGALVTTHQDAAGVFTPLQAGMTDAQGYTRLLAGAVGTETIVSVDQEGYDLWSLHGVGADVLQVPLVVSQAAAANTEGTVTSPFPTANFSTFSNFIADSRRRDDQGRLFDVDTCSIITSEFIYSCSFGPEEVRAHRLAGQCFLSGDFATSLGSFSASGFLRGFASRLPIAPLSGGATESNVDIYVSSLLASMDAEEQAIAIPQQVLSSATAPSLGTLSGDPVITVEALSPGLPGHLPVGLGIPFDQGGGVWVVDGAYPGVADGIDDGGGDLLGELVTQGTIQPDLFIRAELTDTSDNRVGARPRISNQVGALAPVDVPLFQVPGPGGNSGGSAYNLQAVDPLPPWASTGLAGMVRFTLRDSTGRQWTIWRPDPPTSGGNGVDSVSARVADIGFFSGTTLAAGPTTCRVSAFAWESPTASLDTFMWTDVEREHEVFAHTFPVVFTRD